MIEIPEAVVLARQINETIVGKRIMKVVAAKSPHKFAWYYGDPQEYGNVLTGRTITGASAFGGLVEIHAENAAILLGDGVVLRFRTADETTPDKHQLLVEFDDGSTLSASVQMYGAIWCFKNREYENPYYQVAKEKPSPLSDEFNKAYFECILSKPGVDKLTAKILLATEQRIPGLGNGVLQDILFNARIHPRRKVSSFSQEDKESLFFSIRNTLKEITSQGGRDTEKDLFGSPGGYKTKMSRNTVGQPCAVCGSAIKKEAYMGGSIYYCDCCQKR
ncbi:MAG: DNA-formamidopyrimidine glycosylase family protein [Bacillota bacterium]